MGCIHPEVNTTETISDKNWNAAKRKELSELKKVGTVVAIQIAKHCGNCGAQFFVEKEVTL